MKNQYLKYRKWVMKNPKLVYKNIMAILIISFAFIFIQHIYFAPKVLLSATPELYSKSDKVQKEMRDKEAEIEKVVQELKHFKNLRDHGPIDANDSLRIEYLYNQYQKLQNGL